MSARAWSATFNALLKVFAVTLAIALVVVIAFPPKDHRGATGPTGAQGIEGQAGADGEKGDPGRTGKTGDQGKQGATGAKGGGFWGK